MKTFEVTISYRGASTYIVEARSAAAAEKKALQCYARGEDGAQTGAEWEETDDVETRDLTHDRDLFQARQRARPLP